MIIIAEMIEKSRRWNGIQVHNIIRRSINMGKKGRAKNGGIQTDIYGNPVHILNTAGIYRMVKCGECGETVKSSQAKLHLSFGKRLNICHGCLEKIEKGKSVHRGIIIGPSKMSNTIESYGMNMISV